MDWVVLSLFVIAFGCAYLLEVTMRVASVDTLLFSDLAFCFQTMRCACLCMLASKSLLLFYGHRLWRWI